MAEYIDRMKVRIAIIDTKWICDQDEDIAYDMIDSIPAADVEEVKHGEWILGHVEPGYCTPGGNRPWVCSECGQVVSWRLDKPKENFCHNCGAKMNGGKENGSIH